MTTNCPLLCSSTARYGCLFHCKDFLDFSSDNMNDSWCERRDQELYVRLYKIIKSGKSNDATNGIRNCDFNFQASLRRRDPRHMRTQCLAVLHLAQEERPVRSDVEETNLPLISFYSSHIVTTCLSIMQTDKWFKRGNRQNKSSIYVTF